MLLGQLRAKHGSYDEETWCRYEALYEGGRRFRRDVGRFLEQNPQEPGDVYAQRKRAAAYRSYVGPIVDYFAAMLMSAPLEIRALDGIGGETVETDEFYARFKEDVDGNGTDLVDFARASFTTCLVKQWCWWLVTLPPNGGRAPASRTEWEERKLGDARISRLDANCVLDWEYDEVGELLWAITYECTAPRESPLASRGTMRMVWRVFDRQTVSTFELRHDPKKDHQLTDETQVPLVSRVPHGFDRVPLVRVEVPNGLWLLNRVADAQTEHFCLSAGLSWAIRRSCYAMPAFMMSEDTNPQVMGPGYYLKLGNQDKIEWVAPPSAPFDVISKEAKSWKDELYRVSQQMAAGVDNNAAAIGRSGESKLADASATEVCLKAYGTVVREAVEKTFDLVAAGRKETHKFSVTGLDKFNLTDATATVDNATKAKALDIPSRIFKQQSLIATAEALLPGLDQHKKDAMRLEIEKGVVEQEKQAEEAKKQMLEQGAEGEPAAGTAKQGNEQSDDAPTSVRPEN